MKIKTLMMLNKLGVTVRVNDGKITGFYLFNK